MANYKLNITDDVMENENESGKRKPQFNTFDAKNYLDVKLEKGEDKKELKIRLLPIDEETGSPFKTIHMHTLQVPKEVSESGWKSYVCLKYTDDIDHDTFGHDCPFCEMNHEAYEKMKSWQEKLEKAKKADDEFEISKCETEVNRWKQISLNNKESEVCIVRCIERGHEEDGPKFWKFTVRSDGKDPKNLIKQLWKSRKQESIDDAMDEYGVKRPEDLPEDFVPTNILDLETGRDLKVTITRVFDKEGKPTKKTSVSIVDYSKSKPLSKDEDLADEWINDSKVWSDVFTVKPYEYLSIILDGEIPFFDKTNKVWVTKGRARDEDVKRSVAADNEAKEKIDKAKEKALKYEEDDEDEDYEERPKPKKKPRVEEDEEDERPRKRHICNEDDEEDLPY